LNDNSQNKHAKFIHSKLLESNYTNLIETYLINECKQLNLLIPKILVTIEGNKLIKFDDNDMYKLFSNFGMIK